jgi:5'-3' exonuclease
MQPKKTAQTSVALSANQHLMQGLDVVNNKLKTLGVIFGASFRTHGDTQLAINVHKVINVALLVSILGQLQTKESEYNKAGESLKLASFPVFMWEGYTLEAWKHDIALRISQITQAKSEKELKDIQQELTTLMSNEDKLGLLLAKLEKYS